MAAGGRAPFEEPQMCAAQQMDVCLRSHRHVLLYRALTLCHRVAGLLLRVR